MYFSIFDGIKNVFSKGVEFAGGLLGQAANVAGQALTARLGTAIAGPGVTVGGFGGGQLVVGAGSGGARGSRPAVPGSPQAQLDDLFRRENEARIERVQRAGPLAAGGFAPGAAGLEQFLTAQQMLPVAAAQRTGASMTTTSGPFTAIEAAASQAGVPALASQLPRLLAMLRGAAPAAVAGAAGGAVGQAAVDALMAQGGMSMDLSGMRIAGMPGVRIGQFFHFTPTGRIVPNRVSAIPLGDTLHFYENVKLAPSALRRRTRRRCRPR